MKTNAQAGFTLWELLVSILVAGIILGFGIPNFLEFQRNNAMAAAANELVTGILLARSEAVKRQVPITLCASPDPTAANPVCDPTGAGSNGGFIVWVDENGNTDANGSPIVTDGTDGNATVDANEIILLQVADPDANINVFGDFGYITYGTDGFPRRAQGLGFGPVTRVVYCDDRGNRPTTGGSTARVVRFEQTGRGQVQREVADVTAALLITGGVCP